MNLKYLLLTLLMLLIVLPALTQGIPLLLIPVFSFLSSNQYTEAALLGAPIGVIFVGYLWGKSVQLPDRFWPRYSPMLIAIFYILIFWVVAMFISGGDFTHDAFDWLGIGFIPFFAAYFVAALGGEFWIMLWAPLGTYTVFSLAMAFGAYRARKTLVDKKGFAASLSLFCALLLVAGCQGYSRSNNLITEDTTKTVMESIPLSSYRPFNKTNRLTPVDKPSLHIAKDWPRLDGATAAYPVYASAVQAIYQGLDATTVQKYVDSNKTPVAYKRLIDGEVDLIFAAEPSAEQRKMAADKGLTFTQIPFSREAFVFVTSKDNPVTSLTVEQIRGIYSGKINNWSEVGGKDENIIPFQRPVNSGSQTVMLSKVMQGTKMRQPLETEYARGMGSMVRRVANYQNVTNALGYSFRYYASQMDASEKLRLLAVNGVEPSVENVRNGSYPFTTDVYMVTIGNPSANTQKLIDWFLSPQGQKLVEDVGYVAIGEGK